MEEIKSRFCEMNFGSKALDEYELEHIDSNWTRWIFEQNKNKLILSNEPNILSTEGKDLCFRPTSHSTVLSHIATFLKRKNNSLKIGLEQHRENDIVKFNKNDSVLKDSKEDYCLNSTVRSQVETNLSSQQSNSLKKAKEHVIGNDVTNLKINYSSQNEIKINHLSDTNESTNITKEQNITSQTSGKTKTDYQVKTLSNEPLKCDNTTKSAPDQDLGCNPTFRCIACPKAFHRKYHLARHIAKAHEKLLNFKCDRCDKKFNLPDQLQTHILRVHVQTNSVGVKCQVCQTLFAEQDEVISHMISSHNIYKCRMCVRCFDNDRLLKKHVWKVHTGNFDCEICHAKFSDLKYLQKHALTFHKNKKAKK